MPTDSPVFLYRKSKVVVTLDSQAPEQFPSEQPGSCSLSALVSSVVLLLMYVINFVLLTFRAEPLQVAENSEAKQQVVKLRRSQFGGR